MASKFTRDINRETNVEVNGRKVMITLNADGTSGQVWLKGTRTKYEFSIADLWVSASTKGLEVYDYDAKSRE